MRDKSTQFLSMNLDGFLLNDHISQEKEIK